MQYNLSSKSLRAVSTFKPTKKKKNIGYWVLGIYLHSVYGIPVIIMSP